MSFSPRAVAALILYALAYAGSLAVLSRSPGFEAGESLAVLLVFGIGLSLIAWAATLGIVPRPHPVRAPGRESGAIALYLALFAVLVLGYGLSALKAAVPDGRREETAILLLKLATMVVLPAWMFTRIGRPPRGGYAWGELLGLHGFDGKHWRALAILAPLLLGLQLLIGQGPKHIAALEQPGWIVAVCVPLALVWMTLEAGVTEEFLFRVLLQTRVSAWFRSETAGIVAMSLVFGLAHAPGYVLRGGHLMEGMAQAPDPLTAAAYAIAVVSPVGVLFGVLWARTRSLLLVVLLHGWADLVPNLAPFVRTWVA